MAKPGRPVIRVPAQALLNTRTLPRLKNGNAARRLNATQRIALHLLLHRPPQCGGHSDDPLFGPFIDSLPSEFSGHPLAWRINGATDARHDVTDGRARIRRRQREIARILLDHLPPTVERALDELQGRFVLDRDAVHDYLVRDPADD
jgi:hypothetical protein